MSGVSGRRAVFLDRDGVVVETLVSGTKAHAPLSLQDFRLAPTATEDVRRLRNAGLLPVVFTNQPDVGRGLISRAVLNEMHVRLRAALDVEDVLVCEHVADGECECRKPKPGMLRAAAARWDLDLGRSFVIGDRWRDIDAGRAVGCWSVLIDRPWSECSTADIAVADLSGAVAAVLDRLRGA